MNPHNLIKLNELHPKLRADGIAAWAECEAIMPPNIKLWIEQVKRSMKESDVLYAQGRTIPGDIVTDAPGGSSYHNYALAFDFHMITNGNVDYQVGPNWMKIVAIMKKHGWIWGADWNNNGITRAQGDKKEKLVDAPHFQKTFGYNWRDLLALYRSGKVDKDGYVLI